MFGERGPSASDPVPHLGSLLLHECHHLLQIQYSFFRRTYLDKHLVDFGFDLWHPVYCLVRYDFWSLRVDFEPAGCRPSFEVRDHFFELFQRVRHREHVVSDVLV